MKKSIVVAVMMLMPLPLSAETLVRVTEDSPKNVVSISAGLDYAIVTLKLGYDRVIPLSKINRHLILDGGVGIPLMSFDFKDFKINLGGEISLVNFKYFRLPVSVKLLLRNNANAAYNAFGVGTEVGLFPGFYTDKLTLSAEAIWDAQWATRITFSDYYKEVIYPDGTEGWYGATGHVFRFGARVGGLIKKRVEIFFRGGYELHGKYNVKIPPAYGILGTSLRF